MRQVTDAARLRQFMRAFGREAKVVGRAYLVGGASAVLLGWRNTTIDIDLALDASLEPVLRSIPALKDSLQVNVELASPGDFIPEVPGWQDRSPFIAREGKIHFHHYDFYAQALAKIERGHARDLGDLKEMAARGLVAPARLLSFFEAIVPELHRYPAVDPASFRRAVEQAAGELDAT
jgi:hypothetical protein